MSRVITVERCADCPNAERNWYEENVYGEWCKVARRAISVPGDYPFPGWCPLPEKKEESDAKC